MPLYLCQSGLGHAEPWRQGIQVYSAPSDDVIHSTSHSRVIRRVRHAEVILVDDICLDAAGRHWLRLKWPGRKGGFAGYILVETPVTTRTTATTNAREEETGGDASSTAAIAGTDVGSATEEIIGALDAAAHGQAPTGLQDSTNTAAENDNNSQSENEDDAAEEADAGDDPVATAPPPSSSFSTPTVSCLRTGLAFVSSNGMRLLPMYDDGLSPPVACTKVTEDDANVTITNSVMEPVFCRICREGMHDDDDDDQPTPAAEDDDGGGNQTRRTRAAPTNNPAAAPTVAGVASAMGGMTTSRQSSVNIDEEEDDDEEPQDVLDDEAAQLVANLDLSKMDDKVSTTYTGPVEPHPIYVPNPHASENPLLAPCECSGSMAFVHYLCVEQWRCRSRHPDAQNGLACETCKSPYTLPPPSSRPVNAEQQPQQPEDWFDAMPPHVMQALRQPHIMWQIGAAVVRRRWLRPLAPVLMSPIVALYCRARRLLKKRGVARRRWACSLCRRRARWKCVRCLRSYYCSRQCQNVSWHIVHKHVCYKPIRLWWSTVVYGAVILTLIPGILRDPLMYDLGLFLIPFSFVVIGMLAGGVATTLKKSFGTDLRGRLLELTVVLGTLWLSAISWGLVQAFFGNENACHGSLGRRFAIHGQEHDGESGPVALAGQSLVLHWLQRLLFKPAQVYYLMWDGLAARSGPWVAPILCLSQPATNASDVVQGDDLAAAPVHEGCFEHLPFANAQFFVTPTPADDQSIDLDASPAKCAADLLLVWYLYVAAAVAYVGSTLYKYHERRQRRLGQWQQRQQQRAMRPRAHRD